MKEFTIEQKAKAYDEALEEAKMLYKDANADQRYVLESLFPELAEIEDEKIRRVIRGWIYTQPASFFDNGISKEKMLAWIEKQGESKPIGKLQLSEELYEHIRETCACIDDALSSETLADINDYLSMAERSAQSAFDMIEKQGEKKPVDKVEPNFHKGDWVIDKQGIVHQISNVIENVTNHTYGYDIVGGGYFNDNTEGVRLWTIQDAKPGDVLVHNGCTFIFIGIKNGIVQALEENFLDGTNPVCFGEPDKDNDYHPATKEQKELLFNKIRENGFEYDSKKNRYIKKRVPKEYAIIIDGVRHDLINPKIEDCKKCSLDKFCDKFKEALCDSLVGSHTGMIFEKAE